MTNDEIKKWCKSKKITQGELAKQINYSEGMLRQSLNGIKPMQPRMLDAIKKVIADHDEPITCQLPEEIYNELIEKAQAAQQSLDELVKSLARHSLGMQAKPLITQEESQGYDLEARDPFA